MNEEDLKDCVVRMDENMKSLHEKIETIHAILKTGKEKYAPISTAFTVNRIVNAIYGILSAVIIAGILGTATFFFSQGAAAYISYLITTA